MTLTTDSAGGVQSQGAGGVGAGADLTISAGDEIDIRRDARTGTAPTIHADGALSATAANGISGGAGSLIEAGGTLSLTATPGRIGLDRPPAIGRASRRASGRQYVWLAGVPA